jgi:hypothetical protein
MSFFTGFVTGAANEAVDIQKENKSRRQELVDKAMDRFYEFTLPEQRKYAQTQQKLGQTMGALRSAGYSDAEARTLINSFGADKSAAEILQFAKPPKARTTATEPAAEVDQTTAALGQAPTAETTSLRPFKQGESVANEDGSFSTERSVTVQIDGRWANVPSLWMGENGPVQLSEDEAAARAKEYMQKTGQRFPTFSTVEEAVSAAEARSAGGGAMQGELAITGTQTASTMPQEGFDLGRVLFDQNSPERTTGAILAALSAETGLKPEQIDAYLRGEFGPDLMQGETAPVEISPVSRAAEWEEEQIRDRMTIEQENRLSLEEFKQKHDFALAEQQAKNALALAEREAQLKAGESGATKPVDISRASKDAVNGVAGSGLYGEFTTTPAGDVIWSASDPSVSAQAQLHSAMASDEAVTRMVAAQNPNSGIAPNIATGAAAAQDTRAVIETARDASGFIARGAEGGQNATPEYYTNKAGQVVSGLYSASAVNTALEAMYAAWLNAATDDATKQAINASLENVRRMQAGG